MLVDTQKLVDSGGKKSNIKRKFELEILKWKRNWPLQAQGCQSPFFFLNFVPLVMEKVVLVSKKFSTSEQHAEHLSTGRNTQH